MRKVSPGTEVIDQFPAFEEDGYTKRSGLTAGDFTVSAFHNGDTSTLSVTLTEIDSTGEYSVRFIPPSNGVWFVQVLIDFNKEIWQSHIVVGPTEEDLYTLLQTVETDVSRVLGLLHYNAMVDNQEYDSNNQLTYARLRVFDGPANVPTTPGGSEVGGLTQSYEIRASYAGLGIVTSFELKRTL